MNRKEKWMVSTGLMALFILIAWIFMMFGYQVYQRTVNSEITKDKYQNEELIQDTEVILLVTPSPTPELTLEIPVTPEPTPVSTPKPTPSPTPAPTPTPEATSLPEDTSTDSEDRDDSVQVNYTAEEKLEIRTKLVKYLEEYVPGLESGDYAVNGYDTATPYGNMVDASVFFRVYLKEYPGVSVTFAYNINTQLQKVEDPKDILLVDNISIVSDVNELLYGEVVYPDFLNFINQAIPENAEYKLLIRSVNPHASSLLGSDNSGFWKKLSDNTPLYVSCYLLFDQDELNEHVLNFDELNEQICEFASLYFDGLPVNFSISTAQSEKYGNYAEYYLNDHFMDRRSDFYSEIASNSIQIR